MSITYRGTRVLVTGAGGFIGSHLTEALVAAGARVRAMVHYNSRADIGALADVARPVRQRVTILAGDIRDDSFVRDAVHGCAAVFHLAALISIPYSYGHARDVVATNVLGALNILEACRAHRVRRLVHTSTSEVYGTARTVPMTETHPLQAQSPYAASKAGADLVALSYYRSYNLPVVVLRPFNTYGPRQSARAIIPTVLHQWLGGGVLRLGSLAPQRDFTYVQDTVQAFLLAGRVPRIEGKVLHIGSGRSLSVRQLVQTVAHVTGRRAPAIRQERARMRPRRSEVGRLIADARAARRYLKWRPTVALADGLRETLQWIETHPEWYQWDEHFV